MRHDGRANPNQLLLNDDTLADFASLREELLVGSSASISAALTTY